MIDLKTILEIIVASSALIALILSIISIVQSSKFKKEKKHSKRAYIAPVSKPGYLSFGNISKNINPLYVSFQNYGQNPASNVSIELFGIAVEKKGVNEENLVIAFDIINTAFNPIPFNSNIMIDYSLSKLNEVHITEVELTITHYIIALFDYFDNILYKHYKDVFYWNIAAEGRLCELIEDEYIKLKSMDFVEKFLKS